MTPSGSSRAYAAAARDAALARVGHARRWAILGSAGLSAGFAALVSTSPPSHASTARRITPARTPTAPAHPATGSRATREPTLPPLADGTALGLQGPSQAPGTDGGAGSGDNQSSGPSQPQSQPAAPSQQPQSAPAPAPQPQAPVSGGS